RNRPSLPIDPKALFQPNFTVARAELPIAAVRQGNSSARAVFSESCLHVRAEVEPDGIGDLAALAPATRGHQQILPAQFCPIVTQDQNTPVNQAIALGIAVVACLQPGCPGAALAF